MIHDIFNKPILVFGCGNTLLGDDGFGPAVITHLGDHCSLPETVFAMDVGTSIRNILFDLILTPTKPQKILIIDAVSHPDRKPGDLFEMNVDDFPENKTNDYSLHQFPSVNLLKELKGIAGIEVNILAVQAKTIPEAIEPGLSPEIEASVSPACEWILKQIGPNHG
jgi:coenzyme F420 hydrogenase subunit delta